MAPRAGENAAALGSYVQPIDLINRARHSCVIRGFPTVTFVDRHGQTLPTDATHGSAMLVPPAHPVRLIVPPLGEISFSLGGADFDPNSDADCPVAPDLRVTFPGASEARTVHAVNWPYCYGGRVTVSPLVGGTRGPYLTAARSTDRQVIAVTPRSGLRDGQTVAVLVTGFPAGFKIFLSQCSPDREDLGNAGCGRELAAEPVLYTDENGTGSTRLTVRARVAGEACGDRCSIAATPGVGRRHTLVTLTTIRFAPTA